MEKLLSKLLNNLKVGYASFKVFRKLIISGHIYEEIEGDNFFLRSELTLLGDWQNYISYKGTDKPDQLTLHQLLSDDVSLLDQFKVHSQQMLRNLKGIEVFPWLMASILILLSSGFAWFKLGEEYLLLYEKGIGSLSQENLHLLISPGVSAILLVFKKRVIRYAMLLVHGIIKAFNWVRGIFKI